MTPRSTLNRDIAQYQKLRRTIETAEAALAPLRERLLTAAIAGGGAVEGTTATVKAITQERRTILADKLVERGVTPAVIAFATKTTATTYARLYPKKLEVAP
jgi:hypothetical protein